MLATIAPYLVALSAMTFAALSALTIIYSVNRLEPPATGVPVERVEPQPASAIGERPHDTVAA